MRKEKGFSLIEILVAVAILGILIPAVPSALATANRSTTISNKQTMAESLARSQMDYIQSQIYDTQNSTPVYSAITNLPEGYSIVTPFASRLDPLNNGNIIDDSLQKITVIVKYRGEVIYTLISYKVNFDPGALN